MASSTSWVRVMTVRWALCAASAVALVGAVVLAVHVAGLPSEGANLGAGFAEAAALCALGALVFGVRGVRRTSGDDATFSLLLLLAAASCAALPLADLV